MPNPMQANNPLQGRHALITGGGTGIGAAAAEQLHGAGAKLSLLGRRLDPLNAVANPLGGSAIQCDVTDADRIRAAFDEARAANGPIDLLVVNAGIAESAPFHKMTRESWNRIIGVNLTAAFECAQAAIGDLLKSDNGRLVFVASVASLRGVPYAAHYAASKHGLLGLMRSLAAEYAKTNLTVNAVCPGYVDTPMTDQSVARVSQITGPQRRRFALGNHQHECERAAGRPAGDRQRDRDALPALEPRHQRRGDHASTGARAREVRRGDLPADALPVGVRERRRDGDAQPARAEEPADLRKL